MILNIVVIASTPLLFKLVVNFNCHLSAHGVGRFLHYYGDCAVMNTVKIAYSVPDDELVISSSRRKTGNSKQQSLPLRAKHSDIIPTKMYFGRIQILLHKIILKSLTINN
jgi:hypothetical protein